MARYWYVVVDETPFLPERPLTLDQAIEEFREVVAEADEDEVVELRQCSEDDMQWAGEW